MTLQSRGSTALPLCSSVLEAADRLRLTTAPFGGEIWRTDLADLEVCSTLRSPYQCAGSATFSPRPIVAEPVYLAGREPPSWSDEFVQPELAPWRRAIDPVLLGGANESTRALERERARGHGRRDDRDVPAAAPPFLADCDQTTDRRSRHSIPSTMHGTIFMVLERGLLADSLRRPIAEHLRFASRASRDYAQGCTQTPRRSRSALTTPVKFLLLA